ncbi:MULTISPECIES: DUF3108 domain-containing protein [Myxococcaceae]|uniref:DUF3108 domain-containing protein n=1 Tax=Myxococcaceae TaxID=31 RepID=UPI00188ED964|nr:MULTISPECIES: DUF3108 domain-containing protein [Myxococcaceae]MBF5045708.1 DUF3108 domain-containing protein [Simulacricoccus sp. 17bor-14]
MTLRPATLRRALLAAAMVLGALALAVAPVASAQPAAAARPFAAGEALPYDVSLGRFGKCGTGWLRVERAPALRGEAVELLRFDFEAKVGPFHVQHHSRSWLSQGRLASLRYFIDERAPFQKPVQDLVELYPEQQRWEGARARGASTTREPLDELSFLYAVRTLALEPGASLRLDRHFDPRRNPVSVRVLGRERVQVPAGSFDALLVELEVKDPQRYGGRGVLRIHLTDDARRLPVRIESEVPIAGHLVLELQRLPVAPEEES